MSRHMSLLDEWAQATDGTVTLLTETKEAKYDKTEQEWLWDVIGESHDTRVVRMPQGIPIDPRGQIVVGTLRGTTIPALFGEGNLAGELTPASRCSADRSRRATSPRSTTSPRRSRGSTMARGSWASRCWASPSRASRGRCA